MRSKDPAVGLIVLVVLIIVHYGKIEQIIERFMPSSVSDRSIKIIAHIIVIFTIACISLLYYKAAKNPSMALIGGAIAGGFIIRFILNELSQMMFNERYD